MNRTLPFILLCSLLTSCSTLNFITDFWGPRKDGFTSPPTSVYRFEDFQDQMLKLGKDYLTSDGIQGLKLSPSAKAYLEGLYLGLLHNNEILLPENIRPEFYIIKSDTPFYFSLPKAKFFISVGILQKYVKDENALLSILAFETIKSLKSVYNKNIIVPVGYMKTERMISLTRIGVKDKSEINKWVYLVLNRSGHDGMAYLNWLQIQNRNTLDFFLQNGDVKNIIREEFLFKNYIVKKGPTTDNELTKKNSSAGFYQFINEVQKITL